MPPQAERLNWKTAALLLIPPLMWAGNAVVGRLMQGSIAPITFNFLRWVLAALLLLPMAAWVLLPSSGLYRHWRRFALLGLLSVALYNALQYMALKTSTPINVTLVAASMPVWMLILGRVLYGVPISRRASVGSALSLAGVVVVLTRGSARELMALHWVPGDAWMLLAAVTWAWYSWLLARLATGHETDASAQSQALVIPRAIRGDWAAFLLAQVVAGLVWSAAMTAGEWAWMSLDSETSDAPLRWGWPLVLALLYVAIGPSLLAYRAWGMGVARVGPTLTVFFGNLTPLFAALMSAALLGETPKLHHLAGFVLIAGGIAVSVRR